MKKFLLSIAVATCFTMLFSSCEKEMVDKTAPVSNDTVTVTFNTSKSKTYIDGTDVKWASTGEIIYGFEVAKPTGEGNIVVSNKESAEGVTSDGGASMSFGVSFASKSSGFTFDYCAFYPGSAYASGSSVQNVAINTPSTQTPTATSFDPAADLLIAKAVKDQASQPAVLENIQFARAVAVAKMTIKNLESTDPVTKITFSAKNGDTPVKLAGRTAFNLEDASLVNTYGGNVGETSVIIDCANIAQTANTSGGTTIFFTCYPFTLNSENPGSFKVVVETATQAFTKEVSVNSAKGLVLKTGTASTFAVNMDNIVGEDKAFDGCYAFLEYSDVSAQLTNSYGNASVTKTHGDMWSMNATNANSSVIGLKKDDVTSYIKLPDFVDEISSVKITLSEVNASNSLAFDPAQDSKAGDIATVAFVADQLEYTANLSGEHVNTAYIHAVGGQVKIVKVEVVAGTDTREAIAAPATVTAALNNDDVDVTNSIDVSWSSVDGAAGYLITLVPDTGDDVVKRVGAVTSTTVTDLQYDMDYLISVQAEPADYYLNKISAQTTYGDVVTTGAAPSGAIILTESDITTGENTVKGTENGKLAYRLGTSANNGSLTFASGYSSITFKLEPYSNTPRTFSVTNGTINGESSISPSAGSPSGTINANFTRTDTGTEYTIIVTDSSEEVVFSGRRGIVWDFSAVEATPDTRADASLAWKKGGVAADSDTASIEDADDVLPSITLDNSAHSHPVTYSSSNTGVATIVASGVGAGTITLVSAGQTTISAIFAGDEDYKPLTVTYTLTVSDNRTPSYDFETIAELNALVTSASNTYNGYLTGATVSFAPANNTAIVKDATGSVMFYKSGHGLLQGQTYTGAITVTAVKYTDKSSNALYSEVTAWDASFTGDQTTVAPESVTLSQLVGHYDDYQNAYVQVAGLTVTAKNGQNITVTDGANSYIVYDNPNNATCGVDDVINVKGTITKYQTTEEIKVWASADITITGAAPKAVTFTQPTGAAATAGCSIAVTVGGNPHTSGNTVASGTTVTLTATEGTDYEFTSWNVTGATVADASASTTTFTMGTSAVSISATFTSTGGGNPTEKEYYILNTATTAIATSNSYNSYANQSCATGLASPGSYPSTATWSVTCGSKQAAGLWLGANNNQKAKMILSTGSITGASAIASAIGVTTSATYYAAMICHTAFANITKVVLERDSTGGTAPSDVYLLRSTDGGTTYTLVERKADAASLTFTIASPAASAIYAIAIHSTGYCQYKVPVVTFYTTDNN